MSALRQVPSRLIRSFLKNERRQHGSGIKGAGIGVLCGVDADSATRRRGWSRLANASAGFKVIDPASVVAAEMPPKHSSKG